jgi:hypothetical protein
MPAGSIRFVCDCGDRSVTALDAHIPKQTEALFLGNGLDRLIDPALIVLNERQATPPRLA